MKVGQGLGNRSYGIWGKESQATVILVDSEPSEISSLLKKMGFRL